MTKSSTKKITRKTSRVSEIKTESAQVNPRSTMAAFAILALVALTGANALVGLGISEVQAANNNYSITGSYTLTGAVLDLNGTSGADPQTGGNGTQHMAVDWDADQSTSTENWEVAPAGGLTFTPEFFGGNGNNADGFTDNWTASHDYVTLTPGTYTVKVMVYHGNTPGEDGDALNTITFSIVVTDPDPTDVCPNIPDNQETVPAGNVLWEGNCLPDGDGDGIPDEFDNCALVPNPGQEDTDGDGVGDSCDTEEDLVSCSDTFDNDGDTFVDLEDSGCEAFIPTLTIVKNVVGGPAETSDFSFFANAIEIFLDIANELSEGTYTITEEGPSNYAATFSENCPSGSVELVIGDDVICTITNTFEDADSDEVADSEDNCPSTYNPDQADQDGDGIGDVCDDDIDGDTVLNVDDNCVYVPNTDQADLDDDGIGDACEGDIDGDDVPDGDDNCVTTPNTDQADQDGDGIGDVCDDDIDGDDVVNDDDNCITTPNSDQADQDGDGIGDVCDDDIDGDSVVNGDDNCVTTPNSDQADLDEDGIGDVCDDDIDGDDVVNDDDNCVTTPNTDQADTDEDGIGDACDDTDDSEPQDVCPNLEGNQESLPTGYHFEEGSCVQDDNGGGGQDPVDTTDPVSTFDDGRGHQIIETELVALSLTGQSTDATADTGDVESGINNSVNPDLKIYKIADQEFVEGEGFAAEFEGASCSGLSEQVPIEIVSLSLTSVNPLTSTWSHDWTPPADGVYCATVSGAADNAGNVEHTGVAGPFAVNAPATNTGGGSPTVTIIVPSGGFGGGGGGGGGQVLGASTVAPQVLGVETCGIILSEYIKLGIKNNPDEVKKLQEFLNSHEGENLPVTGFYGTMSRDAINRFQVKYFENVLRPWVPHGLATEKTPTGYVYKTTKRWINKLYCETLDIPMPELP